MAQAWKYDDNKNNTRRNVVTCDDVKNREPTFRNGPTAQARAPICPCLHLRSWVPPPPGSPVPTWPRLRVPGTRTMTSRGRTSSYRLHHQSTPGSFVYKKILLFAFFSLASSSSFFLFRPPPHFRVSTSRGFKVGLHNNKNRTVNSAHFSFWVKAVVQLFFLPPFDVTKS